MKSLDIAPQRLHHHHLRDAPFKKPTDVVGWLGAVQAQDYAGAKWALGLRSQGSRDADIEQAFTTGTLLRTHVMRPTWHFVTPADIRWMLKLTAPRVHAVNAYYYRKFGLDETLLARSNVVLTKALQADQLLTREELDTVLQHHGIVQKGLGLAYLVMHAELDGILCSGPRRGKQFTYALLDERVPQTTPLERDEALAELTKRYFTSHGPATLKDYMKWSGLTATDAKAGLERVKSQFIHEEIDGQTYWFSASQPFTKETSPTAYLLPNYDEYFSGYADYSALFDPAYATKLDVLFPHSIVIDGQVVGGWKRVFKKDGVVIVPKLFTSLTDAQQHALALAVDAYSRFLDMPALLS